MEKATTIAYKLVDKRGFYKMSAKYYLLAEFLKEKIAAGEVVPGDKLPSENELAETYSISRSTVRQALSVLQNEGLIERRQGSGSVVKEPLVTPKSTNTIAVITTYIGEYIFPDILRAVEEILTENRYLTMIFATKNRVDNERKILTDILRQPPAGLIIEGTKTALPNPNIDLYNEFKRRGVPIVFIHGWYPELTSAVRVVADDRQGGKIATEYLIEKGHKKIAGIFKSDDLQGHLRYGGYAEAMVSHDLPVTDDNVLWYTTESKNLITVLGKQVLDDCSAVVCYNDEVAIQLLSVLRQDGIQVPDDISVMSFDNSTYSELSVPKISTCSQEKRQIGIQSAEKLISLIEGVAQNSSVLEWKVIEKESVRDVAGER